VRRREVGSGGALIIDFVDCRVLRIELAECREEVRRREVEVAAWQLELNKINNIKEQEQQVWPYAAGGNT
jgi:hypothetical protein